VNNTQVTDKISTILADDHKLGFPEFFVVGDLVMVGVTFTDLENTGITVESDVQAFNFLCVDGLELEV